MPTALAGRGRPVLVLAVLCVCFLPTHVFADELQYLTDNPQMILSVDIAAARKTKTIEELLKTQPVWPYRSGFFFSMILSEMVIESDLRLTWSFAQDGPHFEPTVLIFTAPKKLTIADVKTWFSPPVLKNVAPEELTLKETKHGSVTIYHEDLNLPPFFIDGKYLVVAPLSSKDGIGDEERRLGVLKKIIDRKKTAELSSVMKAGLKVADLTNTVSLVLDFKGLDAKTRQAMIGIFEGLPNYEDIKGNAGKVDGFTFAANEGSKKTTVAATLLCVDKVAAGRIEEIAGKSRANIQTMLAEYSKRVKKMPDFFPDRMQKVLEGASTALSALEISTKGSNVVARVELDRVMTGMPLWALERIKVDVARVQCRSLKNAVQVYMLKNKGQAPKSWQELKTCNPPILEKDAPLIDPWGNPYQFEVVGDVEDVVVFSKGPPGGPRIDSGRRTEVKKAPPGK